MKKLLSLFLALALWAGLGIPASAAGFSDVPADSPFAPAIAWAVEQGVTKGTTPSTFGPGNTCTTSHILTFLWRAAGRPGDAGNERAAVSAWASGLGIGVSDLSAPCTRGQIVTFLYRAMGDKGEAEVPEETEAPAYVLSNGKAITEENVHELLQELRAKYPEGSLYAPVETKISTQVYWSLGYTTGSQCAGWAALASDYIFGKDGYITTHKNFNNMRPGDIFTSEPHTSLIIGRTKCNICGNTGYLTSDSNRTYLVHWDENDPSYGCVCPHCNAAYMNSAYTVITRYPTDVPQYNPVTSGNDSNSTPSGPSDTGAGTEPSTGTGSGNTGTNSTDWAIWSANKSCDLCGGVTPTWTLSADRTRHICSNCSNTTEGRNYIS